MKGCGFLPVWLVELRDRMPEWTEACERVGDTPTRADLVILLKGAVRGYYHDAIFELARKHDLRWAAPATYPRKRRATCVLCGKPNPPNKYRYCSKTCQKRAINERHFLVAALFAEPVECPECHCWGRGVTRAGTPMRFCSKKCANTYNGRIARTSQAVSP